MPNGIPSIRPDNLEAVAKVISWRTKLESPPFNTWLKVLNDSLKTPLDQQPEFRVASENLPPMKIWKEKNPLGYARLTHARAALIELSKQIQIPTENLVTPELVKKICWQQPPSSSSEYESFVITQLTQMGARPWQIEQVSPVIAAKLDAIEPVVVVEPPAGESEAEASA